MYQVCQTLWEGCVSKDKEVLDMLIFQVYHGQEIEGLENIPDTEGAVIVYYHGPVQVDYFALIAEIWLQKNRMVCSVVDRALAKIPWVENTKKYFYMFPGTVDSCAELLK